MTTDNSNIVNATNLSAILDGLLNLDRSTLTDEQNLEVDQTTIHLGGELTSERKSYLGKLKTAETLAALQLVYAPVFKVLEKVTRDSGDNTSIRFPFGREKNTKGEWVWTLTSLPSEAKGDDFFPTGKDLKFRFEGHELNNQALDEHRNPMVNTSGQPVWGRGAKHAAMKLCRAIGLPDKNSPGTTIRRQLEMVDTAGNPAGKSFKRTQLETVEIQHPAVNDGKWQKLTEFYLDFTAPEDEAGE